MSSREWSSYFFRLSGMVFFALGLLWAPANLIDLMTSFDLYGMTISVWILTILSYLGPFLIGLALLRYTDWFVDTAFESVLARVEGSRSLDDIEQSLADSRDTDTEPEDEVETSEKWVLDFPSLHRDDVLAIALTLMGVWVLSSALPDAFAELAAYAMYRNESVDILPGTMLQLLYVAARVALGLYLFFGSYGVVTKWAASQNRSRTRITAMPEGTETRR